MPARVTGWAVFSCRASLMAEQALDEHGAAEIIRVLDSETKGALVAVDQLHDRGVRHVQAHFAVHLDDFIACAASIMSDPHVRARPARSPAW